MERIDITQKLFELLIDTNSYQSPYAKSIGDPEPILTPLIRKRAIQSALISGSFNFLPTYLASFAEIYILLQLQARMVKDIAIILGKEKELNKDILLYCLFKNSHPNLWTGMIRFVGARVLLKPTTYSAFIKILNQLSFKFSLSSNFKFRKRILGILGTLSLSAISFLDTRIVGETAIQIFSKDIIFEEA